MAMVNGLPFTICRTTLKAWKIFTAQPPPNSHCMRSKLDLLFFVPLLLAPFVIPVIIILWIQGYFPWLTI
jgi:hypothetical protein